MGELCWSGFWDKINEKWFVSMDMLCDIIFLEKKLQLIIKLMKG